MNLLTVDPTHRRSLPTVDPIDRWTYPPFNVPNVELTYRRSYPASILPTVQRTYSLNQGSSYILLRIPSTLPSVDQVGAPQKLSTVDSTHRRSYSPSILSAVDLDLLPPSLPHLPSSLPSTVTYVIIALLRPIHSCRIYGRRTYPPMNLLTVDPTHRRSLPTVDPIDRWTYPPFNVPNVELTYRRSYPASILPTVQPTYR